MNRIQWFSAFRGAAYLLAVALLMAGTSKPAAAQSATDDEIYQWEDADGFEDSIEGQLAMEVIAGEGQFTIITVASTDVDYDGEWYGWSASVEADLYSGDQYISDPCGGCSYAATDGSFISVTVEYDDLPPGNDYQTFGSHYVLYEDDCGWNGWWLTCYWYDYVNTYVSVAYEPYIDTISPSSASIGGPPGTIYLTGYNLVDPDTCTANPQITGYGVNLNFVDGDCDYGESATLSYSISPQAPTGDQTLTLSNGFGNSNGVTFTVTDPAPSISSVYPIPPWPANSINYPVTINGSNFGTLPSVSFTDPYITIVGTPSTSPGFLSSGQLSSSQQISLSLNISPNDPGIPSQVIVTSTGYGIGVVEAPSGGSLTATYPVSVTPAAQVPPPAPQIFSGTSTACSGSGDYSNQTVQVLVGQPIAFTACIPSSVDLTTVTQAPTWTPNPNPATSNAAVANFTVTAPAGCGTGPGQTICNYSISKPAFSNATCLAGQQSCSFNTFFFVVPGTYTFTFAYSVNGVSASAWVEFTAIGPTNVNVYLDPVFTQPSPVNGMAPVSIWNDPQSGPTMGLGMNNQTLSPPYGIWLTSSFTPPLPIPYSPGTLLWVQVFTSQTWRELTNSGTWTWHLSGQVSPTGGIYSAVLDTVYPYKYNGAYWFDDPQAGLVGSEFSENYSSTVYLMWDPTIPPPGQTCTAATTSGSGSATIGIPSTCASIPVPLGYVTYGACGDAINTLTNQDTTGTNWTLGCSTEVYPSSFVPNTTYPSWQSTLNAAQPFIPSQP